MCHTGEHGSCVSTVVGCPVQPGDQERLPDTDREEEISCDTPYMWNQKEMIQRNLQNRQKQTHRLREQLMFARGGRRGWTCTHCYI